MKKLVRILAGTALMSAMLLVGCTSDNGNGNGGTGAGTPSPAPANSPAPTGQPATGTQPEQPTTTGAMALFTREEGSGTRSAFVDIVGVVNAAGQDDITQAAFVQSGTSAMMTGVAGNPQALGYTSTGTLNDTVRALSIDGVAPTVENILNGTYAIQRPFIVGYNTQAGLTPLARDFWNFLFSGQAQDLIYSRAVVPVAAGAPEHAASGLTGEVTIIGSSSVLDLMNRLAQLYMDMNPGVTINVSGPGTGQGVTAARDGLADIMMASRYLRPAEVEVISYSTMALDGVAIIVHPSNNIEGVTMEQARNIFLGEITTWDALR